MRRGTLRIICLLACLAVVTPLLAQTGSDPLTGTWTGDWGPTPTHRNDVTVAFKWDGKVLTGMVNPAANPIALQKTSFDAKTGAIHMEADSKAMSGQGTVHFVIDGKLNGKAMTGSWNHGTTKGDFKITKK